MKNKRKRHPFRRFFLILLVLALVAGLCHVGYQGFIKMAYPMKYVDYVEKYAAAYDIPESLVYGVIRCESSFRPDAQSKAGAIGLMQVTPTTFEWAQKREGKKEADYLPSDKLFDPETNIHYGVYIMSLLYQRFPETDTMLAAYNAGQGIVSKWLQDSDYSHDGETLYQIPYQETSRYVVRVNSARAMYRRIYQVD